MSNIQKTGDAEEEEEKIIWQCMALKVDVGCWPEGWWCVVRKHFHGLDGGIFWYCSFYHNFNKHINFFFFFFCKSRWYIDFIFPLSIFTSSLGGKKSMEMESRLGKAHIVGFLSTHVNGQIKTINSFKNQPTKNLHWKSAIVKPQYTAAQTCTDSRTNSKMHSTKLSEEDHPSSPPSTLQSKIEEEEEVGRGGRLAVRRWWAGLPKSTSRPCQSIGDHPFHPHLGVIHLSRPSQAPLPPDELWNVHYVCAGMWREWASASADSLYQPTMSPISTISTIRLHYKAP